MALITIKTEPEELQNSEQVCRLCLSSDSLENVFQEENLHRWIWDYLSIEVSAEDRISQVVCSLCRMQLTEFHQFRMRCQEVQSVLQSMEPEEETQTGNFDYKANSYPNIDEPYQSDEFQNDKFEPDDNKSSLIEPLKIKIEPESELLDDRKEVIPLEEQSKPIEVEDMIDIGDIKVEPGTKGRKKKKLPLQPVHCSICNKLCTDRHKLKRHIRITHGPRMHGCAICGYYTTIQRDLRNHLRTKQHFKKSHEKLTNESTAISSSSGQSENKHTTTMENEETLDTKEANVEQQPKEASIVKENQLQCDVCQKTFPPDAKSSLIDHKWYAHGRNKHECPICQRPFIHRHKMHTHMRTHEGKEQRIAREKAEGLEKSIKCELCPKEFRLQKSYEYHKKQTHGFTMHVCLICGKPFAYPYQLKEHMNSNDHTVDPTRKRQKTGAYSAVENGKFKCNICEKQFNKLNSLKMHIKSNHEAKRYSCSICAKPFAFQCFLRVHMKSHENNGKRKRRRKRISVPTSSASEGSCYEEEIPEVTESNMDH